MKLWSFQILRFVAALGVLIYHAGWTADGVVGPADLRAIGAAGVDLFFVISGAIIYLTAFERPMPAAEFAHRRIVRIAPLYFLVSIAALPTFLFLGREITAAQVATTFTFWPAWGHITTPILDAGWTLSFEMLFYAGAALVLVSRRWLPVLAVGYAAMWVLRDATGCPVARFLGNPMTMEFVAGVLLMRYRHQMRMRPVFAGAVAIAAVALLFIPISRSVVADGEKTMEGMRAALRLLIFGVPAVLLVWSALNLGREATGLPARLGAYLGDASYSIYLTHAPLALLVGPVLTLMGLSSWSLMGVLVAAQIVCGAACYEWLEKPLLKALRPKTAMIGETACA